MSDPGLAERKRTAASVSLADLGPLFSHVDAVVAVIDHRGRLAFVSPSVRLVLGYDPGVLVGCPVVDLLTPPVARTVERSWAEVIGRSGSMYVDGVSVRDVTDSWVEVVVNIATGPEVAAFGSAIVTLRPADASATPVEALRVRLAEDDRLVRLASTFVGLPIERFDDGVNSALALLGSLPHVDRTSVMRVRGDSLVRTHQWCAPGVPNSTNAVIPLEWVEQRFHGPDGLRDMYFEVPEESPAEPIAGLVEMQSEGILSTFAVPIVHDGRFAGFVSYGSREVGPLREHTSVDLLRSAGGLLGEALARHDAEIQLAHRARHDPLTELANRWAFRELLADALDGLVAGASEGFAVLLLDLDRFKVVNDSLGHLVGDQLLAAIAQRLQDEALPGEHLGRLGGDEIVVLLAGRTDEADALRRARELVSSLAEPFEVGTHELIVTVSGGVAMASPGLAADELVSRADAAMFRAKDRGRRRVEVFDEALRQQVSQRLQRESELSRALRDRQLVLHYQPEVDLATGKVRGAEALLRWHHPIEGLLTAGQFIGLAEDTGQILEIGDWVLSTACRQLARWREAGRDLILRVNVSARQINQPDLVDRLVEVIAESGAPPSALCLELTETAVMADAELSLEVLGKLAGLGLQLAVDDFGTGYSSLSYLKRFPVHVLKIDQSFVDGLGRSNDDAAIVEAILSVAEALALDVTAEGIETDVQLEALRQLGCPSGQGFLFAPALSAPDFEDCVAADAWRRA